MKALAPASRTAPLAVLACALAGCAGPTRQAPEVSSATAVAPPEEEPLVKGAAVLDAGKLAACARVPADGLRVELAYDGRALRITDCAPLRGARFQPTRRPPIRHDQTGTWVELTDAHGAVTYQLGLGDGLLDPHVEAPAEGGELARARAPGDRARSISVVVPSRDAASLALYDSEDRAQGKPSVLVARLPLR